MVFGCVDEEYFVQEDFLGWRK